MFIKNTILTLFFLLKNTLASSLLSTPGEHLDFIKNSFKKAEHEIIIFSPFISLDSMTTNNFLTRADKAIKKGVNIIVYIDQAFNEETNSSGEILAKSSALSGVATLQVLGIKVKTVLNLHSKNIIIDDNLITFGSFNWLSAVTKTDSEFCNFETTVIIQNVDAQQHINTLKSKISEFIEVSLSTKTKLKVSWNKKVIRQFDEGFCYINYIAKKYKHTIQVNHDQADKSFNWFFMPSNIYIIYQRLGKPDKDTEKLIKEHTHESPREEKYKFKSLKQAQDDALISFYEYYIGLPKSCV